MVESSKFLGVIINSSLDLSDHMSVVNREDSTRNSSGDEKANVNFLYDDIVHVLQNTIDSCINSATDRRGYVKKNACVYQIQ